MNLQRLHEILAESTQLLRQGPEVDYQEIVPGVSVLTVDAMPPVSSVPPDMGIEVVDCSLVSVGVHKGKAEEHREELIEILREYPDPATLKGDPSYITVGGAIGDQGAAFMLFALGKVVGLWDVITPEKLGITGPKAKEFAGVGYVMITGFDVNKSYAAIDAL